MTRREIVSGVLHTSKPNDKAGDSISLEQLRREFHIQTQVRQSRAHVDPGKDGHAPRGKDGDTQLSVVGFPHPMGPALGLASSVWSSGPVKGELEAWFDKIDYRVL